MLTVTKALEEALLQHFIYQKLDIAYAINKPFPFFEALRDNYFITERMYKESLEACQNLVPLSRVVHSVLTKLEKTFSLRLLMALFSRVNLREYPNLGAVFRSFQKVGAVYGGWGRTTPILLKAPADPAEGSSLQTLLPLPPSQPPPSSRPSCASGVNDPKASSQQILELLDEQLHPSDPDIPHPGLMQEGRSTPVSSRDHQTEDKQDPREMSHAPLGPVPGNLPLVLAFPFPGHLHTKKRKRCIWSTPKRRRQKKHSPQGAASPAHEPQEKLKAGTPKEDDSTGPLKVVRSTQKKRIECARASSSQEISNETSEMNSGESKHHAALVLPEKPEDDTADFLSLTLPVTCGEAKGILYKEKMKAGSSEKCIRNEQGAWLTPKEFLVEGKRAKSKDWKRSMHCGGKTLRHLQEKGLLFCPPTVNLKK
uniref:Sp110 nuclear body protein n=1 Tax=Nannospalax galili TaxID=1026970 RepID=A0A8C6W3T0_NANGA